MKKVMAAIGILIFVCGVLLAASTFIGIPKNTNEAYQVPESTVLVDRFGLIGPTFGVVNPTADWVDGFTFNTRDSLNIQVNVTSGKTINFYVDDGSKGSNSNLDSTIYLSYPNVTTVNTDWIVPKNSSYNFVFTSSGTALASDVHWQIIKQWNETEYRSVTKNVPLLPFQVLYIGVGTAWSGLAITVYEVSLKKDRLVAKTFSQHHALKSKLPYCHRPKHSMFGSLRRKRFFD